MTAITFCWMLASDWASQVMLVALACQCGDISDAVSIPGSGRSSGRGHGNPLQYSCLENLMDRGTWWATVHGGHKELDWRRQWHPTPVLLPGKLPWMEEPGGLQSMGVTKSQTRLK